MAYPPPPFMVGDVDLSYPAYTAVTGLSPNRLKASSFLAGP
jgi:hypothetical protein